MRWHGHNLLPGISIHLPRAAAKRNFIPAMRKLTVFLSSDCDKFIAVKDAVLNLRKFKPSL